MEDHTMAKRTSIYIGDDMQAYIAAHQGDGESVSGIINAAIDRLRYLLQTAEPDLTDAEWTLIYNTQSSAATMPPAQTVSAIVAAVEDSIALDHMDREYDVDGPALAAKLRTLDRLGRMAVIDRAERWWARNE
jgi:hypothetical protein